MSNASAVVNISATLVDEVLSIKSGDLFCGVRTVCIEHAGQRYLLRLTRENKLILTK